jgi:hypothetical protein
MSHIDFIKKYGLKYYPSLQNYDDNFRDAPFDAKGFKVEVEYSDRDHKILKNTIITLGNNCNLILEIGVARFKKNNNPSTYTLLKNKLPECVYVGVDVEDKKYILSEGFENTHTIKTSSSNIDKVMDYIKKISGNESIDLLHIDGDHSVNQVIDDWRFSKYLSKNGAIVMHDTNVHPGPTELIKALNLDLFEVTKYFENRTDDWGITIIRKK